MSPMGPSDDSSTEPDVLMPATYMVQGGAFVTILPCNTDAGMEDCPPWFLKNANEDSGCDNNVCASFDECLKKSACMIPHQKGRRSGLSNNDAIYVVQPHIPKPMLIDGHKFDLRLLICVVARMPSVTSNA